MKLAIVSDTHYGVRNDNIAFIDQSKKFFDDVFFPYLVENKIKVLIHLGDLVDRRKYININTAKRLRTDFLDRIEELGIEFHMIAGNHDTYFKNSNSTNSLYELGVHKYATSKVYIEPTEVMFGSIKILFVPWICDDNRERTLSMIKDTNAQICFGHLELSGFEMFKGSNISHGDDPVTFNKFDVVCSGHFHHRSSDGHIFYLGNHMEFTWSDYDDPKGFHIFDTKDRSLTFIQNPHRMFKKVWYDDSEPLQDVDFSEYTGCIVKLIVKNKSNLYTFDKFVENLVNANPLEMQIVEDHLNITLVDDETIVDEAESTIEIFKRYIDDISEIDKKKLENTIVDLYNEAVAIE